MYTAFETISAKEWIERLYADSIQSRSELIFFWKNLFIVGVFFPFILMIN